jgi:hypothetical protein
MILQQANRSVPRTRKQNSYVSFPDWLRTSLTARAAVGSRTLSASALTAEQHHRGWPPETFLSETSDGSPSFSGSRPSTRRATLLSLPAALLCTAAFLGALSETRPAAAAATALEALSATDSPTSTSGREKVNTTVTHRVGIRGAGIREYKDIRSGGWVRRVQLLEGFSVCRAR